MPFNILNVNKPLHHVLILFQMQFFQCLKNSKVYITCHSLKDHFLGEEKVVKSMMDFLLLMDMGKPTSITTAVTDLYG